MLNPRRRQRGEVAARRGHRQIRPAELLEGRAGIEARRGEGRGGRSSLAPPDPPHQAPGKPRRHRRGEGRGCRRRRRGEEAARRWCRQIRPAELSEAAPVPEGRGERPPLVTDVTCKSQPLEEEERDGKEPSEEEEERETIWEDGKKSWWDQP